MGYGIKVISLRILQQAPGTSVRTLKLGLQPLVGARSGTPSAITIRMEDTI
jgi:hypothetical protein